MNLILMVAKGCHEGKVIRIHLDTFRIGRGSECQLRPVSSKVSRCHCALLVRESGAFVQDFRSANGTFVNGHMVEGELELHDGDTLGVGPLAFVVHIDDGTPATFVKTEEEDQAAAILLELDKLETSVEENANPNNTSGTSTLTDMSALSCTETTIKPVSEGVSKSVRLASTTGKSSQAAHAILEKYQRRSRS